MATIDLDREDLITLSQLVDWRIDDHRRVMRDIAPEDVIECGTAEDYAEAKARVAALQPLCRALYDALDRSKPPFDPANFPGLRFEG